MEIIVTLSEFELDEIDYKQVNLIGCLFYEIEVQIGS